MGLSTEDSYYGAFGIRGFMGCLLAGFVIERYQPYSGLVRLSGRDDANGPALAGARS